VQAQGKNSAYFELEVQVPRFLWCSCPESLRCGDGSGAV